MVETLESRLLRHGADPIASYPLGTLVPWLTEPIEPTSPETEDTSSPLPNRNVASISGFTLVNAGTGDDLLTMMNGSDLDLTGAVMQSLRANIRDDGAVGSVQFLVDGKVFRSDSDAPYSISEDVNGDYAAWLIPVGIHRLTALPFSERNATGIPGSPQTISLTIID